MTVLSRQPGIYRDLSWSDYFRTEGLSHHVLEGFIPPNTPAHGRELMLNPRDQTDAQAFGHAFHAAVLEPARFETEFVVPPKLDKRKTADKITWKNFEAANAGREFLTSDEMDACRAMGESVMGHATAREMLTGRGAKELSLAWVDEATGMKCKARIDLLAEYGGWTWIIDLKTTRCAWERIFQRDIAKYGYHRQLAWYRRGLNALSAKPRRCAILAVEKERPYCCAMHEIEERALEQGDRENQAALETFARCVETGEWPGYEQGLTLVDLPPWSVDTLD